MKVFLTGAAGFIGFHTALALLREGHHVFGYDSVNDYYDPHYKLKRLDILNSHSQFTFQKGLLEDEQSLTKCYRQFDPSHVIHLAAQAGVRYSLTNPKVYIQSNIVGFQNILELVRESKPENFIYASSSSVYGSNKELPFHEEQNVCNPISLYAATKSSNELAAKTYGHLFEVKNTGLRFFTVYGPYGRPDMALFLFTKNILKGEKISLFNHGNMVRDFTYIEDIVDGILKATKKPQINKIYNLGRGKKETLSDYVAHLEKYLGMKAERELLPMQAGDVMETSADVTKAKKELGYNPKTNIEEGIPHFVNWYKEQHKV